MNRLSFNQRLVFLFMGTAILATFIVGFKEQLTFLLGINRSNLMITLKATKTLNIDSVEIFLQDSHGEILDTAITDKKGRATFFDLKQGRYEYSIPFFDTVFNFSVNISGIENTSDVDSVYTRNELKYLPKDNINKPSTDSVSLKPYLMGPLHINNSDKIIKSDLHDNLNAGQYYLLYHL